MSSLATSHKAHYCNQLKHVAQPIFYATFYKHYFYWDSSKIKLFFQKNAKLSSAWGLRPQTPVPLAARDKAPRPPE